MLTKVNSVVNMVLALAKLTTVIDHFSFVPITASFCRALAFEDPGTNAPPEAPYHLASRGHKFATSSLAIAGGIAYRIANQSGVPISLRITRRCMPRLRYVLVASSSVARNGLT
ncbi:unnamed protein product [Dicrocoelium dendriticum]|nr:unnamed protein product [Dicrocoelium dendriticum]